MDTGPARQCILVHWLSLALVWPQPQKLQSGQVLDTRVRILASSFSYRIWSSYFLFSFFRSVSSQGPRHSFPSRFLPMLELFVKHSTRLSSRNKTRTTRREPHNEVSLVILLSSVLLRCLHPWPPWKPAPFKFPHPFLVSLLSFNDLSLKTFRSFCSYSIGDLSIHWRIYLLSCFSFTEKSSLLSWLWVNIYRYLPPSGAGLVLR